MSSLCIECGNEIIMDPSTGHLDWFCSLDCSEAQYELQEVPLEEALWWAYHSNGPTIAPPKDLDYEDDRASFTDLVNFLPNPLAQPYGLCHAQPMGQEADSEEEDNHEWVGPGPALVATG